MNRPERKDTYKEEATLIDWGNEFHSLGPKTEKALSPLDFKRECVIVNSLSEDDLRVLGGEYGQIRSEIYCKGGFPAGVQAARLPND